MRVQGTPGWKNYENCSLGISLGSRNQAGPALAAIVRWASGRFEKCLVDLSDTLNRYNYMIEDGLSEPDAHAGALRDGDRWLADNGSILAGLGMPYEIIRWDHWMNHPDLASYKQAFRRAFETDSGFRAAVLTDVEAYYLRRRNENLSQVSDGDRQLSIDYLIEELAVHSILYAHYSCATLYPGKQQACFEMVRKGKVADVPTGLRKSYFTRLSLYSRG